MRLLSIACWLMAATVIVAQEMPTTDGYSVNFDRDMQRTRTDRVLTRLIMEGSSVKVDDPKRMYHDLTRQQFVVHPGQTVKPVFGYSGTWMQGYIYIDFNRNGCFDVSKPGGKGELGEGNELVTFAGMSLDGGKYNSAGEQLSNLAGVQPPQFTIPEDLEPGYYMMRWKVDWDNCDPAGRVDEENSIIQNGGAIADVLLHVTSEPVGGGYQLVFSDEFDQPNGSVPDGTKWVASTRRKSTWNRWISSAPEVAFIQSGHLVCRAIPNPDTTADDVPMITGAMETKDRFSFTYGKVEVRLRTEPYRGNFPAAWMMPQPPCEGWPNAGEIDIFEAIDDQNTAYQTVHSHWTYDLGHKNDPKSSFTKSVNVGKWHVYGVEWAEDFMVFTIDGAVTGIYERSSDPEKLAQGQWPFTHPFYLILNQSVGNGSWAKAADTSHTYETRFDYIRVYQLQTTTDDILGIKNEERSNRSTDSGALGARIKSQEAIYDIYGRKVADSASSTLCQTLPKGMYLQGGRKMVIK